MHSQSSPKHLKIPSHLYFLTMATFYLFIYCNPSSPVCTAYIPRCGPCTGQPARGHILKENPLSPEVNSSSSRQESRWACANTHTHPSTPATPHACHAGMLIGQMVCRQPQLPRVQWSHISWRHWLPLFFLSLWLLLSFHLFLCSAPGERDNDIDFPFVEGHSTDTFIWVLTRCKFLH